MTETAGSATPGPPFQRCPRCGYSLRGLPANHACPECGLRYDAQCELFRVINPRQVLLVWIAIIGSGWVALRNLPHVLNFAAASAWEKIGAMAAVIWVPFVITAITFLVARYRRGFSAAVTADGMIIRLPGFSDHLIPWCDIRKAVVKDVDPNRPQVALVSLWDSRKKLDIGGLYNVFPTRAHVDRFVEQVNQRTDGERSGPMA